MAAPLGATAPHRLQLRDEVQEELASTVMLYGESLLKSISTLGWCLKGGGAVWWRTLSVLRSEWASAELKMTLKALHLDQVYDIDFSAPEESPRDALERAKSIDWAPRELWARCGTLLQSRRCLLDPQPQQILFEPCARVAVDVSPGPLAASVHTGCSNNGKDFTLLRLSLVARHCGGFTVRAPCVDVCFGDMPESTSRCLGVTCASLQWLYADNLRMIFTESEWAPWLCEKQYKVLRRLRRAVGLAVFIDYPLLGDWRGLCYILTDVLQCEKDFVHWNRVHVLSELSALRGPDSFTTLCAHIGICLDGANKFESNASMYDYHDILELLVDASGAAMNAR